MCTGGEPLLQLDRDAIDGFHAHGFAVAVETNGTQQPPAGIDWLCVSPKARANLVVQDAGRYGDLVCASRRHAGSS